MRVTLLGPQATRDGGVAGHLLESAAALEAAGHEVRLVCAISDYAIPGLPGVAYADLADAAGLEATLREGSPEVVHGHDVAYPRVVDVARRVAPTVLSAHAYAGCTPNTHYFAPGVECDRPHGPGCLVNMAVRGCLHARDPRPVPDKYRQARRRLRAYRRADGVLAHSSAVVRHLERNGLPVRHVPLLTRMEAERPTPLPADGRAQVLFVGRVAYEKGLDVLLRALAGLPVAATVVGDGPALPAARTLAVSLGIADRVRFAGWLAGDALVAAYRQATIVAVPSRWPEPFGLVGLEAMALARPVVGSRTGGIGDWLDDGITGLGVPPDRPDPLRAALEALVADRDRARAMGLAGRRVLDGRFGAASHVAALEVAYADAARSWSVPAR